MQIDSFSIFDKLALMKKCFFCAYNRDKNKKIWESENLFAMFNQYPVSPGHTLIIPKRHVVYLIDLTPEEWQEINKGIHEVINISANTDLQKVYTDIMKMHLSPESVWYCKSALKNSNLNKLPSAYNHGINDGQAAGRTVDHFHWHIIPRFKNDVPDPRGGILHVIPNKGNYKLSRSKNL